MDWLPVDVAASTITEILDSDCDVDGDGDGDRGKYQVYNIVNPYPIPWSDVVSMLRKQTEKEIEVVGMREWAGKLNALAETGESKVPGLRLLGFFEGMVDEEDGNGGRVFETGVTEGVSGALRGCGGFNEGWLERCVGVWREMGFLE